MLPPNDASVVFLRSLAGLPLWYLRVTFTNDGTLKRVGFAIAIDLALVIVHLWAIRLAVKTDGDFATGGRGSEVFAIPAGLAIVLLCLDVVTLFKVQA